MVSQFLLFDSTWDMLDCQKIKENVTIFSTIGILIVYDAATLRLSLKRKSFSMRFLWDLIYRTSLISIPP